MSKPTPAWLTTELEWGLHETSAPPELWDRVMAAQQVRPVPREVVRPRLIWAWAAAALLVIAIGLASTYRRSAESDQALALRALSGASQIAGFHCQNPAQLRAWVRAQTGLDLPLRPDASASIELIGAQTTDDARGVEVAYRAGNRDAVLLVSRADSSIRNSPHDRASGNVSSWVMDGQRFTLASDSSADLQIACKLCHLD
ncbi:MAG TPA: hypothetical protein VFW44_17575 [Bryobacteraceae bacterium]|nr:hypothetical protein [Bryobacteraceae bacterium]